MMPHEDTLDDVSVFLSAYHRAPSMVRLLQGYGKNPRRQFQILEIELSVDSLAEFADLVLDDVPAQSAFDLLSKGLDRYWFLGVQLDNGERRR